MNGVAVIDSAYTPDTAGRILANYGVSARDHWTYGYDDLDRLASAANLGDPALSETFTYAKFLPRPYAANRWRGPRDNMLSRSRNPGGSFATGGAAPFAYTYSAGTAARPHALLASLPPEPQSAHRYVQLCEEKMVPEEYQIFVFSYLISLLY